MIQVLDARKRILGLEHPNTIIAMANLSVTYSSIGKYTEAETLDIKQGREFLEWNTQTQSLPWEI